MDCEQCGFALWLPYAQLSVSSLGLYSDSRFPGRSLLSLREHADRVEDLPEQLYIEFMRDVREASAKLRWLTGAERVNIALLSNAEQHVHAHLIPRRPALEPAPRKSPWDDPRARAPLSPGDEAHTLQHLRDGFSEQHNS